MATDTNNAINNITLRIKDAKLEQEYQEDVAKKSINQYRFAVGTGILFFCAFFFIDKYTYPVAVEAFDFVRFYFAIPGLAVIFFSTFTRFYKVYARMMNLLAIVIAGASILLMSYLGSNDPHISHLYVSLIILFFYLYAFLNVSYLRALVVGMGFVVLYLMIAWYISKTSTNTFFNMSFMLSGSSIIGVAIAYMVERQSKVGFLLRRQLSETVVMDALTELYNRYYYEQYSVNELQSFIERSRGLLGVERRHTYMKAAKYGLVMVDIDFFKRINDTFGHSSGDLVLKQFAGVLKNSVRRTDDVLRFGGEEFLMIIKLTSEEFLIQFVKKLGRMIEDYDFVIEGSSVIGCTASIGMVVAPGEEGDSVDDLLRYADRALYKSKDSGRNCGHRVYKIQDEIEFEMIHW